MVKEKENKIDRHYTADRYCEHFLILLSSVRANYYARIHDRTYLFSYHLFHSTDSVQNNLF